jgi:hypothetical protein
METFFKAVEILTVTSTAVTVYCVLFYVLQRGAR